MSAALTLTVYKGTTVPTTQNTTNYYQWEYTPLVIDGWQKTTTYGNLTIKPEFCTADGNSATFCVGIPDYLPNEIFYHEEWTIELTNGDSTLFNDIFYLEKPTRGFAKSHGDKLSFSIDPFTEMKAPASDYIILKNTGNVPLNITIDFKALDELLTYTESNDLIPPYSQQNYKLELSAPSWKPQRIQQPGSAEAEVSEYYLLGEEVSGTAISLQTALIIDVPTITIFVGHSSYELVTLDDSTGFSFQYQKSISMNEGETRMLSSYISGDGTATLSIQANNNISVLQTSLNDEVAHSPLTIISTNNNEQRISVQIKALSENRDGQITYTLKTDSGTKTFTTNIDVGPPAKTNQPASIGSTSSVTIIVLLVLITVGGYMLYNHLVLGRRKT